MRFALVLCGAIALSGCSFFGIYNRSVEYINAEETAPTLLADGTELASVDKYLIPELTPVPAKPDSIMVPAPLPLIVEEEQESTSLTDYRSSELNPRIERDGSGALVMHLDGNFTALWASVTDAIAKSSLKLNDLNRSTGTWYIEIQERTEEKKRGWWSRMWGKDKKVSNTYLLKLSRTRSGGYLSLLKDTETLAEESLNQQTLKELQQKLEK